MINLYVLYSYNGIEIIEKLFLGLFFTLAGIIIIFWKNETSNKTSKFKRNFGIFFLITGLIWSSLLLISQLPLYFSVKKKIDGNKIFHLTGSIEDCTDKERREISCISINDVVFHGSSQLFGNKLFGYDVLTEQVLSTDNIVKVDYVKVSSGNFIIKFESNTPSRSGNAID